MPNIHGIPLLGDQNFLNYAVFDLKFTADPDQRPRQSGLCVSGMRIRDATKRVMKIQTGTLNYVIINIGSVDIAENRHLIQMIRDFDELIETLEMNSITPILTTLAPLPTCLRDHKKEILVGFNQYIRMLSREHPIIDLYQCMIKSDDETVNYNLYQPEPRYVSGSNKSFLLWNRLGRHRIDRMLSHNLGFTIVKEHNFIGCDF